MGRVTVDVGARLKQLREARGLSINALSKRAGLAQSTLSYVEAGRKQPTVATLGLICKALDIALHDFFTPDTTQPTVPDRLLRLVESATVLETDQADLLAAFLRTLRKE